MSEPLLRTEALYKFYGSESARTAVLRDVSLSVERGRFVTVMGPSGSGKSTLLHLVSGLEPPSGGSVTLAGQDLWALSEKKRTILRRDLIGFVFQFYNLIPNLTVEQNIRLPLMIGARLQPAAPGGRKDLAGVASAAAEAGGIKAAKGLAVAEGSLGSVGDSDDEQVARLVEFFRLGTKLGAYPHTLSGGEMQRVSVARALVARPAIVMADEPTGNISSSAGEEVMRLFRRSCDELGQTILLVTHNARDAACSDEVHFLKDGELQTAQRLAGAAVTPERIAASLSALSI